MPNTSTTWLDQLLAQFPTVTVGDATPSAANANKSPRDALLALLNNSIAVAQNPAFTVTKRGKTYQPEVCHRINGGMAEVVLKYCRDKITLPGGRTALNVPVAALVPLLTALKGQVEAGVFDEQLETIKSKRTAALKKGAKATGGKKKAA